MSAARYVGRLGGLAVAFGVGSAVLSGVAVASADTGTPDASTSRDTSSSRDTSAASSPSAPGPVANRGVRRANRTEAAPAASTQRPSAQSRAASAAAAPGRIVTPKPGAASNAIGDPAPAPKETAPSIDVEDLPSGTRATPDAVPTADRQFASAGTRASRAAVASAVTMPADPGGSATLTVAPPVAAKATALSSVPDPNALPARVTLQGIAIMALSTTLSFTSTMLQQIAIAIHIGPSKSMFNQTVDLNGYNLVPSSTELVTSFYGPWTYAPGGLNIVQGQQDYNVFDPDTEQTVGSFEALVSSGKALMLGEYVELLVTSADGNTGTGVGQVPPVGSVIARMKVLGGFGWSYSALSSLSGNVVSFALTTPFGDIPLPFIKFDAAKGIADHTVDDRPIYLGNGYSLAPTDPTGEIYTGTSGLLPVFQTVQSQQQFDIRDSAGTPVGTFDAVVTTTWDILGTYTEAILVTDSQGDNIGTGIGQVPPPGTVYNVIYSGDDENFGLYTSMPSPSGDLISMIQVSPGKVANILAFPLNLLDASNPPAVKRLPFTGGYGILPTSDLVPTGVNGLPPRDVQIQGYQQFGVYDPTGVQQGSFDAIVANQWDFLGISSQAIMVTKVNAGTAGTAAGDVPPVGSVLNYVYVGNGGFGTSYWSLPSPSGTEISYKFLTPIIDIPTWSTYNASAGIDTVTFVNPLHAV